MAGLRITEVSLSLYAVLALPVAIRYFVANMVRSPPGGGSWRTACLALAYGNVPDEWVFGFQGSQLVFPGCD